MYGWFNPLPSKTDFLFFQVLYTRNTYETLQIKETIGEKLKMSLRPSVITLEGDHHLHTVKDILSESGGMRPTRMDVYVGYPPACSLSKPLFACCTEKNPCVNQAKEGNAVSHNAYVPCVVD